MKLKYLYIAIILILLIVTFNQQRSVRNLQAELGNNYLVHVRSALNATDIKATSDLTLLSDTLLAESESLNKLPNNYFTSIAEILRDIAIQIKLRAHDDRAIRTELEKIHQSLFYINSNIPDHPLDWYKELKNDESTVFSQANDVLK